MTAPTTSRRRSPVRTGKLRGKGKRWRTKLYAPTNARGSYRVAYKDGDEWQYRSASDLDEANEVFDQVERWLDAGASKRTPGNDGTRQVATVADLADRYLERCEDNGNRKRTLANRRRNLRVHVLPKIGALPVAMWTSSHSRKVLNAARNKGLAPATVQGIGAVMVGLVSEAHRKPRLLPPDENPMEDVKFRVRARHQGQVAEYVPPSERPTTDAVERLCVALWHRGRRHGRPWYLLMGQIAGFGGIRYSELIALRPESYDPQRRVLIIDRTIEEEDGTLEWAPTKNEQTRDVPVSRSIHRHLVRRCLEVQAQPVGDDPEFPLGGRGGLLFPGPDGQPWKRAIFRKVVFLPAAREAGWEMVGDKPTATGLMRGGSARLTWHSLRHHAATWLHHVVGLEWEDVSEILGHWNVAFTLATYVRRAANREATARAALDRF